MSGKADNEQVLVHPETEKKPSVEYPVSENNCIFAKPVQAYPSCAGLTTMNIYIHTNY